MIALRTGQDSALSVSFTHLMKTFILWTQDDGAADGARGADARN